MYIFFYVYGYAAARPVAYIRLKYWLAQWIQSYGLVMESLSMELSKTILKSPPGLFGEYMLMIWYFCLLWLIMALRILPSVSWNVCVIFIFLLLIRIATPY